VQLHQRLDDAQQLRAVALDLLLAGGVAQDRDEAERSISARSSAVSRREVCKKASSRLWATTAAPGSISLLIRPGAAGGWR